MTEGSSPDDEEGKKGQDLFAHVPDYQPFQHEPVWPGQQPTPPARHQHPSQAQNQNQGQVSDPTAHPDGAPAAGQGYPQLQLPTKPKMTRPNLPLNRLPEPGEANGFHSGAPGIPGGPGFSGAPGTSGFRAGPGAQGGTGMAGHPGSPAPINTVGTGGSPAQGPGGSPWDRNLTNALPGESNPGFTPPTPAPTQENPGFVPTNTGAIQIDIGTAPQAKLLPGAPIITSTSAKPNWTQPHWPSGNPMDGPQRSGYGSVLARRATGSRLPPAIAPLPEAPYSQAPPTSGNVQRNLFGAHQGQGQLQNQVDFNLSLGQPNQGLRSQLPFTIQRDLILAKQLFGDQLNQPAVKERREYKQTEYIPKAPKIKVSAPDPVQPWKPVPAATYEFFPDEEHPQARPQSSTLGQGQPQNDAHFPRGFNPANPSGIEDGDDQPDPRYAPFQGELKKDVARQDKRWGQPDEPIPTETRERGVAALRALGRNSDHYYETHQAAAGEQGELPQAVRLTSRDLYGLVTYYFIVTKDVLTSPQTFFANMSLVGGLNDPLLYLAFTSVMTGLFAALAKLNPLLFFFSAIFSFFGVALGAVIMQFVFKRLGSEGKFEQTFNVLAYSKATFIFAWISLGPWPIGLALATVFTAYLNYLGLSRVHKLPTTTTWLIIGIMTAVPVIFKLIIK